MVPLVGVNRKMNKRREKYKATVNQSVDENVVATPTTKAVPKEKLILESGKFCLDMAKLIFGGVILAAIMKQDVEVSILFTVGLIVVLVFVVTGLYKINKLNYIGDIVYGTDLFFNSRRNHWIAGLYMGGELFPQDRYLTE